jgi:hypothetical protein
MAKKETYTKGEKISMYASETRDKARQESGKEEGKKERGNPIGFAVMAQDPQQLALIERALSGISC